MANTRIKDITISATSAASDDYLALDGSTNGTRKITTANLATSMGVKNITISTSTPTSSQGSNGDIWIVV